MEDSQRSIRGTLFVAMLAGLALVLDARPAFGDVVCHLPDAQIKVGKILDVPDVALRDHLAHGDAPGICSVPEPGATLTTLEEFIQVARNEALARSMAEYDRKALSDLSGADQDYDENSVPPSLTEIGACIENQIEVLTALGSPIAGWAWALGRSDETLTGSGGFARAPWEEIDPGVPMTPTKPMLIASVSKVLAAAAIVRFFELTGIGLDDRLFQTIRDRVSGDDFLSRPALRTNPVVVAALGGQTFEVPVDFGGVPLTVTVPISAASTNEIVTFRHLLTHHSGYRDYGCTAIQMLAQFVDGPLLPVGVPGRYGEGGSAEYANMNFCVLELTLEALMAGASLSGLEEFLRRAVFVPAGIPDVICGVRQPATLFYGSADLRDGNDRPGRLMGVPDGLLTCAPGGVSASAEELLAFLRFLRSTENSSFFRQVFFDECIREGEPNLFEWQKCTGFFRVRQVAGLEAVHNGGLGKDGQGMASVMFHLPFGIDGVLMWNTAGAPKDPEAVLGGCFRTAVTIANEGVPNPD